MNPKRSKRIGNKPFFLSIARNDPHTPSIAGKAFAGVSKGGVRGDVIAELDWGFGEMIKAFGEAGIPSRDCETDVENGETDALRTRRIQALPSGQRDRPFPTPRSSAMGRIGKRSMRPCEREK
ncbi:hypothetical protein [Novipirellula aureliae]|uniref:hypothetical protein n=1 Tax=Novipirellula aureliae TaxID=2527966 RepID=UPI0011B59270|nr:hypothetical protein [Novipirellula aureliae]